MKGPRWLGRVDCLVLHELVLSRHGGKPGVRDAAALEAALAKPRQLRDAGPRHPSELAAAYAAALVASAPFHGGNKRTSLLAAATFLELNGHEFVAGEVDAVVQTLALAAGELDEVGFASWLRQNSRRAPT